MLNEKEKNDNLFGPFIRPIMALKGPPLHDLLGLLEELINKSANGGFRALTCAPTFSSGLASLGLLPLPLSGRLFRRHPECHELLHSHTLGGCWMCAKEVGST